MNPNTGIAEEKRTPIVIACGKGMSNETIEAICRAAEVARKTYGTEKGEQTDGGVQMCARCGITPIYKDFEWCLSCRPELLAKEGEQT